ncbi:MAG: hypothetical protein AUJ72_03735 [Candidatus Omnitrophica bacterium CG1_02_46_14]|nr:MAG: hypothetical protein AUJ72_03735 [Candidatus Omnitrophica bacterium CG1_02_46_14]
MKSKLLIVIIFLSLCNALSSNPSYGATQDDAFYQGIFDETKLKTFFLRRIANDISDDDIPFYDPQNTSMPTDSSPKGIFLHTADVNDLNTLFNAVGKRIQLKLVK